MSERLTKRKYGGIVSAKREQEGIICSKFCDNCPQGTGNCKYVKEMVEKLAEYEDLDEIFENHFDKEALELLSDKDEFAKWLDRTRWTAKRIDEINRELEQYKSLDEQGLLVKLQKDGADNGRVD